jgi:hypothetical protein
MILRNYNPEFSINFSLDGIFNDFDKATINFTVAFARPLRVYTFPVAVIIAAEK